MNRVVLIAMMMVLGVMNSRAWAQSTSENMTIPILPNLHVFNGYEPMSLKALLNLYWKVGLLSLDDEKAITEYIQVSDCKLYHARFEDDFAWPETLKATRNYIKTYGPHFSTQIMTLQQVGLGRYLPDKKIFQINDDTQYRSVERMFFADYANGRPPCEKVGFPTSAPLRALIDIGDPFSLTEISIPSDDFARKVIHVIDDRMKKVDVNFEERKRFAYVRFYYTVRAFKKLNQGESIAAGIQGAALEFMGRLDGYEVTADFDGLIPIYQWVNPKGQNTMGTAAPSLVTTAPGPASSAPAPVGLGSSH